MRAFLCLFFVACNLQALPEPYVVSDLRVIAVVAEPPDVAPGETARLSVYFYDPDGGGRPVNVTFYQCDEPGEVGCLVEGSPSVILGEGVATQIGTDLHRYDADVLVEASALGGVDVLGQFYGIERTFVFRGDNGVRVIDGLKRLKITAAMQPKNRNPSFNGFMIELLGRDLGDDRSVTRLARDQVYVMRPLFDPAVLEAYTVLDFSQQPLNLVEEASFAWSCSPSCDIDQRVTFGQDIVSIIPPLLEAENNRFAIHVLMRDGRGGQALLVREFELVPETVNLSDEAAGANP